MAVQETHDDSISNTTASLSEILSLDPATSVLTFDNTLGALDSLRFEFYLPLHRFHVLGQTSNKEEVRKAATDAIASLLKWGRDNVNFNPELCQVIAAFSGTDEARGLSGERLWLLTKTLADCERRGMALGEDDRAKLTEWQDRLSELTTEIDTNIMNDEGAVEFMVKELAGLTEQQLAALHCDANTTLHTALTVIRTQCNLIATCANQSNARLKNVRAGNQRAMTENGELILEVVQMRQKIASLLGFEHWADCRTASKMAGNGGTAHRFIENLNDRLDGRFFEEKELLLDLKKEHLGDPTVADLKREDARFHLNILMEMEHQIDQEKVAECFEEEATLRGIFNLCEELFDISITSHPSGAPGGAWADDVQFICICEKGDERSPLGGVCLDLHPGTGKFKHFGMFGLVQGYCLTDDANGGGVSHQAPLAAIVGDWPVPAGSANVSLWKFDEAATMFHEIGHVLHNVLTCTEFLSLAGAAVPHDFAEVPSMMLERWLEDINVAR